MTSATALPPRVLEVLAKTAAEEKMSIYSLRKHIARGRGYSSSGRCAQSRARAKAARAMRRRHYTLNQIARWLGWPDALHHTAVLKMVRDV